MVTADGKFSIVFNGEIYNYWQLRSELSSWDFETTSDTEVLLALYATQGASMLQRLRGMFAFAIWDEDARELFIARDPYGIKPLYYTETSAGFLCASTVKSLLASGLPSREPDPRGQASFWLTGSVMEPNTWFRDIAAVPAGHCGVVRPGSLIELREWHSIAADWRLATREPSTDLAPLVRDAVTDSVHAHQVSDVPVGILLSGGIDSGALAGMIHDPAQVTGLTLAFDEFRGSHEDERDPAGQIAKHYGISNVVRTVSRSEFKDDLDQVLRDMDQPSIDGLNTWYASKGLAEQGLKVALTGAGGDELFQGYPHFRTLPPAVRLWEKVSRMPGSLALGRRLAAKQAQRSGNAKWLDAPELSRTLAGAWLARRGLFGPSELSSVMGADLAAEAAQHGSPVTWVEAASGPLPRDPSVAISLLESVGYLRNQLLRDADWASMAHGVELRTPLVDSHLLRALAPYARGFQTKPPKLLLANAPARALPMQIIQRKKTGFGIPVAGWLPEDARRDRGHPTRDWARLAARAAETL